MNGHRPSAPALVKRHASGVAAAVLCLSHNMIWCRICSTLDACVATAFTCVPSPNYYDVHAFAAAGKAGSVHPLAVAKSQLPASQSPDRAAAQQHTPAAEQTPCALLKSPSHLHVLFRLQQQWSCLFAPSGHSCSG